MHVLCSVTTVITVSLVCAHTPSQGKQRLNKLQLIGSPSIHCKDEAVHPTLVILAFLASLTVIHHLPSHNQFLRCSSAAEPPDLLFCLLLQQMF